MLQKLKISIFIIIYTTALNPVFAADIPIIVIAPSQKAQSKSTVGTSVTVFDEAKIGKSNDFFLGDVLGNDTPSLNSFKTGGHGSSSGIQLRGLPKRYSTVFIDGVKQSDPASVSNDFDFSHILKNQISRVEILHGNQTSVYGSGAIGGTINIVTKRGKPGFQKDISYNTASNKTHNLALSMSGANDKNDFYIGLERFITAGISAMKTNDEKDGYRNNSLLANYGYKFNDKLKLENSFRFTDGYLQYDTKGNVTHVRKDSDEQQQNELSASASLIYKPNKQFTNRLIYSKYNIERIYNTYDHGQDSYYGYRNSLNYFGNYNIDLDSSVVFGLDTEFDEVDYNEDDLKSISAFSPSPTQTISIKLFFIQISGAKVGKTPPATTGILFFCLYSLISSIIFIPSSHISSVHERANKSGLNSLTFLCKSSFQLTSFILKSFFSISFE